MKKLPSPICDLKEEIGPEQIRWDIYWRALVSVSMQYRNRKELETEDQKSANKNAIMRTKQRVVKIYVIIIFS